MATANLFRKGHRICLDITSMDLPTGVAGATNAEYVPYHICEQDGRAPHLSRPRAAIAPAAAGHPDFKLTVGGRRSDSHGLLLGILRRAPELGDGRAVGAQRVAEEVL